MYKSLLLNSLSLASIYTFDLLLLPLVQDQGTWFHRNFGLFYEVLWLLPVVGAAFYLNVGITWDRDQADHSASYFSATYLSLNRVHGVISLPNGHIPCSMALKLPPKL